MNSFLFYFFMEGVRIGQNNCLLCVDAKEVSNHCYDFGVKGECQIYLRSVSLPLKLHSL